MEHEPATKLLKAISGRGLLVVGDFMIDRTIYGEASRISPEAPTPVIRVEESRRQLGGAGNVVRNVDSLGGKVWCAGVIGNDETAGILKELLCEVRGCQACCMIQEPGRKTTLKTRVVAVQPGRRTERPYGHQQIVRLDEETCHPVSAETSAQLLDFVSQVISQIDGVVVSDYAKGALPPPLLESLIAMARRVGKPVFVDPKATDLIRYAGASVLTPNAAEAEAALGISFTAFEEATNQGLGKAVQRQLHDIHVGALLVTRGAEGVSLIDREGFHHFPTSAREVFDVTGAGDTLLAAFSLAAASGANYRDAAQFGNLAAGVAVSKAGAAAVYPFEVEREISLRHHSAETKILSRERIGALAETLRRENKRIVFTNGCFDLLHVGHVYLLREARKLGDVLVVGLNSDRSVKGLKGNGRPIVSGDDRAFAVAGLEGVGYVVMFDEPDPRDLIQLIRPDVLVKGDDYKESEVVGADFVRSYGGVTRLIPLRQGISTSALVEKIRAVQEEKDRGA
jgi:D-beta-D-heptose 7-phosphate kinase / D-beta-D-heptose 1-phosphate adenosyltransferase